MALNIKQITNFSNTIKTAPIEEINNKKYYVLELGEVVKFGYVCEREGLHFPIYLKMNNEFKKIFVGKTGIFEITEDVSITGIKVPLGISFTIDYVVKGE